MSGRTENSLIWSGLGTFYTRHLIDQHLQRFKNIKCHFKRTEVSNVVQTTIRYHRHMLYLNLLQNPERL